MTEGTSWKIPPSVHVWLKKVPTDKPVAVLMRHSVRPYLAPLDSGYDLSITDTGKALAEELGEMLGNRLRSFHASVHHD